MWRLILHGGAGNGSYNPEVQSFLDNLAERGGRELDQGAHADAVVLMVIRVMESSPLFNAGAGGVRTQDGTIELDASIMRGDQSYGAVTGVSVEHPIDLAAAIMDGLNGDFHYFYEINKHGKPASPLQVDPTAPKEGETVGCVALDTYGHLCAGSSTGGVPRKPSHRIGDSSMIGLGTYADDNVVAVTTSGMGEAMVPYVISFHVWALMKYGNKTLEQALTFLIKKVIPKRTAGIIAIDIDGNTFFAYNTKNFPVAFMDPETLYSLSDSH